MTEATTRDRILDVALEHFQTKGFSATSLRDIAEDTGVTKAALYYHFTSKDDILLSLTRPLLDATDVLLEEAAEASQSPRALLAAYLDLLLEYRGILAAVALDRAVLSHPDIGRRIRTSTQQLQQLLAGPEADLNARVRAVAAIGALRAAASLFAEGGSEIREPILASAEAALGLAAS